MMTVKPNAMHQLPSPRVYPEHFCPLCLGTGITEENTTTKPWLEQAFYTLKRDRLASTEGISAPWEAGCLVVQTEQLRMAPLSCYGR
jgi:hypothetical protein